MTSLVKNFIFKNSFIFSISSKSVKENPSTLMLTDGENVKIHCWFEISLETDFIAGATFCKNFRSSLFTEYLRSNTLIQIHQTLDLCKKTFEISMQKSSILCG